MKLVQQFEPKHYSEVAQRRPCTFAFALVEDFYVKVQHFPVKCRDFLNDTLCWKAGEAPHGSIYKYDFNGDIETRMTCLVIYDFGNIKNNIKALNNVEVELGLEPTVVTELDPPNAVLITGDKFWMKTTVHFSYYTTVLRGLTYKQEITSLEEIPYECWMEDEHKFIPKLPKILFDMPVTKVMGCKEIDEDDLEGTMHEHNGWKTACTYYTSSFNLYGEYIRGKLSEA